MIDFKELKTLIQKASITNRTNLNDMFGFSIDIEALQEMLSKKSNLHILDLTDDDTGVIKSKKPGNSDYALVSEYVYKKEAFDTIFDGHSEIASFIIYCDDNDVVAGSFEKTAENRTEIINSIMAELPVYRTLVIRRFNIKEEKFDYLIYFRSNRVMINYIKTLREDGEFENNTGDVETTPIDITDIEADK